MVPETRGLWTELVGNAVSNRYRSAVVSGLRRHKKDGESLALQDRRSGTANGARGTGRLYVPFAIWTTMDLIVLAAILALSVMLGWAGARLFLQLVLHFLMRETAPAHVDAGRRVPPAATQSARVAVATHPALK